MSLRRESRRRGAGIVEVLVKVFVTPRKGILDPQGRAVEQSLHSLGFDGVGSVRVGRYILLDLDASDVDQARETARKICEALLANPLIEDFTLEVEPSASQATTRDREGR